MKMVNNLVHFTTYIRPEQYRALKRIKKKTALSVAMLIREAVDVVIKKYKN